MELTLDHLRSFFARYRRQEANAPELTKAAVLIPFFVKDGSLHLLLTLRTDTVEHHKGQVSFPGGASERDDSDAVATALREAEEEIGLPRSSVDVLGLFDDYISPSGFRITPVVGLVRSLPPLDPNRTEVAAVFDAPVTFFLDKNNERVVRRLRGEEYHDVYFYNVGPHEVWGVTAAILRSLLNTIVLRGPDDVRSSRS